MGIALLGVVISTVIFGLTRANNTAANERNRTAAKVLCQQAIEQALSANYDPPAHVPAVFGTWPVPSTMTEVLNEQVVLHSEEGLIVNGTRRCRAALAGGNVVQFTASVEWNYRGQPFTFELHTMRAPGVME